MKRILLSMILLVMLTGRAFGVNFFNWNADSATTSRGTCTFIAASIDSSGGHDGRGAMLYNMPGSDGQAGCTNLQNGDIGNITWTSGRTIYYRWWMKIGDTFSWGSRAHMKLGRLEANGSDLLTPYLDATNINVESSNGSGCGGGVCGSISYAFNGAAAHNYQEYVLALTLQTGTASTDTGKLELFVNGTSVGSFTHNLYGSAGSGNVQAATWGMAMAQAFYPQLSGGGGPLWVDDFSVDDVWNSNYGGPPPVQDTQAPTNPAGLAAQAAGANSITLTWTASTDNVAVAGYQVDRCSGAGCSGFGQIATSVTASYNDSSASASTAYSYRVRAYDAASNVSGNSNTASAVTPAATATECTPNWQTDHPSWLWCDDFEQDRLSSYYDNDSPALLARASGIGFNNTYGMRATWTAGQVNAGSLKIAFGLTPAGAGMTHPAGVDTTTKFQEIYYRAYLKSQAGWVGQGSGHNSKFTRTAVFTSSAWAEAAIAHLWSNDTGGNNNYLLIDPATCVTGGTVNCTSYNGSQIVYLGGTIGTTPIFTSPNTGNWNCIEAHVKLNTSGLSDGIQEFWVDGVLQASRTNLNFRGTYTGYGLNTVLFENYINGGASQGQSRYWDNLVISTQRVGCANAPMVTLPATPTGLRKVN
jgi:hypothetical protein